MNSDDVNTLFQERARIGNLEGFKLSRLMLIRGETVELEATWDIDREDFLVVDPHPKTVIKIHDKIKTRDIVWIIHSEETSQIQGTVTFLHITKESTSCTITIVERCWASFPLGIIKSGFLPTILWAQRFLDSPEIFPLRVALKN